MEKQSSKRRWTKAEDAKLARRALVGWPTLRVLAVTLGRTHVATLTRASRLRAIRVPLLDPAERAAREPSVIECLYCGSAFLASVGQRYCSGECSTLGVGVNPGDTVTAA